MAEPRIVVFASGTKDGGGSGFQAVVEASRQGELVANVVAVVSQYEDGGVRKRALKLNVPFVHFTKRLEYQGIVSEYEADYVLLSGWTSLATGLDPTRTINVHPAPLPEFGGKGMYGLSVHHAVLKAFDNGTLIFTSLTMHFVTEKFDAGLVFFRWPIRVFSNDTATTLRDRVKSFEHTWVSRILNRVVRGEIRLPDVNDPASLVLPTPYTWHLPIDLHAGTRK